MTDLRARYRIPRGWIRRLALLAGLGALTAGGAAWAAEFELRGSEYVQTDWAPNRYKVFCGDYNWVARNNLGIRRVDPDLKRDAPCFSPKFNRLIEGLTAKRLMGIKAMGFRAPRYFGPRVNPTLIGEPHIRLYDTNEPKFANTTVICTNEIIRIRIGQRLREFANRSYLISYFLSHELFHVVQQAYPVSSKTKPCGITKGWIGESTADVVALDLTRRAYSYRFPADTEREARRFAGLRRYYVPLNIKINDKKKDMTGHPIH